jgi:hypothetical protein
MTDYSGPAERCPGYDSVISNNRIPSQSEPK